MTQSPHPIATAPRRKRLHFGRTCHALTLSACLLAACTHSASIPVVDGAGPGPQIASGELAGEIFAKACIKTEPSFQGARAALQPYGFRQNRQTGTFYHARLNLSVKVSKGQCSMVFGTNQPVDPVIAALARGTAKEIPRREDLPRDIDVSSDQAPDGLRYFRMGLKR